MTLKVSICIHTYKIYDFAEVIDSNCQCPLAKISIDINMRNVGFQLLMVTNCQQQKRTKRETTTTTEAQCKAATALNKFSG